MNWAQIMAALKRHGYTGDITPGKAAIEAIKSFLGNDGTIVGPDGKTFDIAELEALAGIEADDGDGIKITVGSKSAGDNDDEENDDHEFVERVKRADEARKRVIAPITSHTKMRRPTHLRLKHFSGDNAVERAERMGHFFGAAIYGMPKSLDYCRANGIQIKAGSGSSNTLGGVLVPDEFVSEIIDLREKYGILRPFCRVWTMKHDTASVPRRTGGLTAYAVGENDSDGVTASDKAWDNVSLVAKKWGVLTRYSTELEEDAIINYGDDLAGEMGYAFANKEDNAALNGDGTSTYHGMVGIRNKIGSAGVSTATNTTWASLTAAEFSAAKGKLPGYVFERGNPMWIVSRQFWHSAMERLVLASGGTTKAEAGAPTPLQFFGDPVLITQAMPTATAVTTICALYGDLKLSTMFGDRRMLTIKRSEERYLEYDQIGILGTTRFDINNHSVGDSSTAGPIVALKTGT